MTCRRVGRTVVCNKHSRIEMKTVAKVSWSHNLGAILYTRKNSRMKNPTYDAINARTYTRLPLRTSTRTCTPNTLIYLVYHQHQLVADVDARGYNVAEEDNN